EERFVLPSGVRSRKLYRPAGVDSSTLTFTSTRCSANLSSIGAPVNPLGTTTGWKGGSITLVISPVKPRWLNSIASARARFAPSTVRVNAVPRWMPGGVADVMVGGRTCPSPAAVEAARAATQRMEPRIDMITAPDAQRTLLTSG